jgi:hypothetical protein
LFDQRFFLVTILTPGCPELQENDFAFDRFIIEAFARGGFRAETWGGLTIIIAGECCCGEKQAEAGREADARPHGAE